MTESNDGIILSIAVENFFCHEHYKIDFNKNVNFVVGQNGSGKSAFVAAVVIGFGGRAKLTNRGTNQAAYIKRGSDSAAVEIKLKNSGVNAYKPDVYGRTITIVRRIQRSGGSSYKIKSDNGKVESMSFEEVKNIAAFHNIQVDNPVAILNQDEARGFHENDDRKKYSFFRRATNFDETEKNYNSTITLCKKAKNVQESKKQTFDKMDSEYKNWEALYKRMQSEEQIEQQKKALENEYYWSEVGELERKAEALEADVAAREATCGELRDSLQAIHAGASEEAVQRARAQLEAGAAARGALERRLEAARAAQREATAAARAAQLAAARRRDLLVREARKCVDLRHGIQEIQARAGGGVRRAELEARAEAARRGAEAARARHDTAALDAQQARDNAEAARDASDAADDALRKAERKHEKMVEELRNLEASSGNSLAAYGQQMVELVSRVQAAAARGVFSAKPRGPVGAFIKVQDMQWAIALEHILGKSCTSFCVNSDKDARELFKIIKEVFSGHGGDENKPTVSVSAFRAHAHDVSRHAVRAPGHVTPLDVLRVDDPVVANFLIDNCALETVLLVHDQETAASLTNDERKVPRGLRRVVTQECAEYYPKPNYRSYGAARRRFVRYLHRDVADTIRQARAGAAAEQRAVEAARGAAAAAAERRRAADEAARAAERDLRAHLAALRAADAELQAAADALADHHAPTHHALEEELKESEKRMAALEQELRESSAADAAGAGAGGEGADDVVELSAALQRARDQCSALSCTVERYKLDMERRASERAAMEARLARARDDAGAARQRLDAARAAARAAAAAAAQLCPRVDNPRPKETVEHELQKARAILAQRSGTTLSRAEVLEKLVAVRSRRNAVKRSLARVRALIDQIQTTAEAHLEICFKTQTDIVRQVQHSYSCHLNVRGYTGYLTVNKARGELSIGMGGGGGGGGGASGGERSYTTMAFFMALWDCIDLPFFFLDEFDVYMDNLNRMTVMQLLVSHALERHPERQFVFLTPQDGSTIEGNERVTIFRLKSARGN